ncbi:hypothetical protein PR048_009844 [Dryococelus australis]|uniref:Uncharacterized protein n=1 Tax=Dryococelus australis TaxID=614101 RepID=A0ABQ9I118_9NEOP|nr:hypothetical protein PR048_009844 [Dryococelus australis]
MLQRPGEWLWKHSPTTTLQPEAIHQAVEQRFERARENQDECVSRKYPQPCTGIHPFSVMLFPVQWVVLSEQDLKRYLVQILAEEPGLNNQNNQFREWASQFRQQHLHPVQLP